MDQDRLEPTPATTRKGLEPSKVILSKRIPLRRDFLWPSGIFPALIIVVEANLARIYPGISGENPFISGTARAREHSPNSQPWSEIHPV
jgi:hypothetical protein